ncbi:crossover junction endonuclease EME1 [Hyla sarda]|uniref:crossover junction endonuclease EME1 n=1 Tax=Hyla sarda TaxID=327740 RepID=UPI0024C23FB9|nr:crossover junction endonuclease EME1 [Hyla sarda]
MSSSSEAIEPEDLSAVPFLVTAERQSNVIMVLSSSSDDEDELPGAPLLHRLHVPEARLELHRSTSSRDPLTKPLKGAARCPPKQPSFSHEPLGASSLSSSDAAKVPHPEKRKKIDGKKMDVVTVHIDPVLLQDGSGGVVLSALQAQETPCVIQSHPVSRSITWSRSGVNIDGDAFSQEDAEILVLVPVEDFVAMILNHKKGASENNVTLSSFVANIVANKSCAIPSLVVTELEKYFKNQKTKDRKRLKEVIRGEAAKDKGHKRIHKGEPQQLSRVDVEEALMVLQVYKDVYVWFLETAKEFSDFVCMFSKAMTEAPAKRQRDNSSFSFYLDGDWAKGLKVERCGKGLLEVWKKQMQQFNRVSVEVASAVVAVYPSPQLLVKAYHHCKADAERHNLLSDILVRRGEGVTSTSRRVGPELSKRIYLQFMSSEPELSLDL